MIAVDNSSSEWNYLFVDKKLAALNKKRKIQINGQIYSNNEHSFFVVYKVFASSGNFTKGLKN